MQKPESTTELIASAENQITATEQSPKKEFVVPEVSVPVDVLEATTFFQVFCIIGLLLQIEVSSVLWGGTVLLTVISALGYIYEGIKIINVSSSKNIH